MRYRNSKQRQAILEVIGREGGHLTAERIYSSVKRDVARLSLGTVYRNLRILVEQGLIRELDFGADARYYEAAKDAHQHLICRGCGMVADIEVGARRSLRAIIAQVSERSGFSIDEPRLDFFGRCPDCLARDKGRRA